MRFRSPSSPPPYLNRRDQYRLLLLVGSLAGLVFAMQALGRPVVWRWMFSGEGEPAPAAGKTARDVDFSVRFDDRALADDEFLAQAEAPVDGVDATSNESPAPTAQASRSPSDPAPVEIDREKLRDVQDDYVGLRAAEADAYFHTLSRAAVVDQAALERASAGTVDFAVIMDDPDRFRGRAVTVEGELKGLLPVPAAGNTHGVESLWEAWIFNRNSWPNPWCVRILEVPDGIPQGSRLSQDVRVRATGYFFKKYGYASEGGFHKAPLLIGKRLQWLPSAATQPEAVAGLGQWLMGVAVVVAAGLGIMVWRFRVSDRRFEQSHLKRLTEAPRESIDALSGMETTDMSELFRRLAEEDSSGAAAPVDTQHPGRTAP